MGRLQRALCRQLYAISAEFVGALLLIPGIYVPCASLYAMPLMIGAAHFWLVPRASILLRQAANSRFFGRSCYSSRAVLGDGPYALKPSPLPGILYFVPGVSN
jgi:putative oxidoreductase